MNRALLWDVNFVPRNSPIASLPGHLAAVKGATWHERSPFVVTTAGSDDPKIRLWDLSRAHEPNLVSSVNTFHQVTSVHWQGNRLFSTHGGRHPMIATWNINPRNYSIHQEHVLHQQGRVQGSSISASGKWLAALSGGECVSTYKLVDSVNKDHASQSLQSKFSIR
jgi:WD40 repeat protein